MVKIYLAGGMANVPYETYINRRKKIADEIRKNASHDCEIFNPADYYNYKYNYHKSEKEVFRFELNNVRNSNVVLVDFNDTKSIGTTVELAIAYENRIPIIGLNEDKNTLHPWYEEMCDRICDSIEEASDYLNEYYIDRR